MIVYYAFGMKQRIDEKTFSISDPQKIIYHTQVVCVYKIVFNKSYLNWKIEVNFNVITEKYNDVDNIIQNIIGKYII